MKATVDTQACVGCQLCTAICPGVFQMCDEFAVTFGADIPTEQVVAAFEAFDACPVRAIDLEEPSYAM